MEVGERDDRLRWTSRSRH